MTVKDDIKKVKATIEANEAQKVTVAPNATPARSYPSPTIAYEDNAFFDTPFVRQNVTSRAMWKVNETAIQQSKVITTALPAATSASGIAISPATTNATLVAVPDLTIAVKATGAQVQIGWSVSASLSLNTATASFAVFRDGVRIGSVVYGQSVANNQKFTVSNSFTDTPGLGFHGYSVYWATTAGTLTADGKNRSVSGLVLRPQ